MADHDRSAIATLILDELSETVLKVGALLDEAFETYGEFGDWVEDELPLQPHTAERIRAMYHLYQFKPDNPELPPAWQALWSLG